jgi:glutamine---fructose-6-phosphate transaminase (isomerizing)
MNSESILNNLLGIPNALLNCLKFYLSEEGIKKLNTISNSKNTLNAETIIFIGHSYNYFASLVSYYYINSLMQFSKKENQNSLSFNCVIEEIDEFLTYYNFQLNNLKTIFVFVSQSGDSIQIKDGFQKLLNNNIKLENIFSVGSNSESYIAKNLLPDHFLPIISGKEEVIGTKSYVNTIFTLYLISKVLVGEVPISSKLEDEVRQLIFEMKFYGEDSEFHTKALVKFLGDDFKFLYFISKGASLSTAYQAAQSCTAYTRTFAEGISLGLFVHGPFQIVDDKFRCLLIIGDDTSIEDTIEVMDLITKKIGKGKVILINNNRKLSSLGRANENIYVFEHTTTNPYLAPIFEIIVIQYLLLEQAKKRGVIN